MPDDKNLNEVPLLTSVQQTPNYGTYHHATPEQSELVRQTLRGAFHKAFQRISNPGDVRRVLDAGCGLGFLSEVTARYFGDSTVTGVDLFGTKSLPEGNIKLAADNMIVAGLHDRVNFVRSDLTSLNFPAEYFDLVVSNLVFHNLGRSRFKAYDGIVTVMKTGAFFVIGDFFFSKTRDMEFLRKRMKLVDEINGIEKMPDAYSIMIFRK